MHIGKGERGEEQRMNVELTTESTGCVGGERRWHQLRSSVPRADCQAREGEERGKRVRRGWSAEADARREGGACCKGVRKIELGSSRYKSGTVQEAPVWEWVGGDMLSPVSIKRRRCGAGKGVRAHAAHWHATAQAWRGCQGWGSQISAVSSFGVAWRQQRERKGARPPLSKVRPGSAVNEGSRGQARGQR